LEHISLEISDGGKEYRDFLKHYVFPYIKNGLSKNNEDAVKLTLNSGNICVSTDSFVVNPVFFPGGDIGKLAICGTANDLAVSGARPAFFTLSFIIENKFPVADFEKIMKSIKNECDNADIKVVCGDLKVLPEKNVDSIYINTTGIGIAVENPPYGYDKITEGDEIIISSDAGTHGASIMMARNDFGFQGKIESDCRNVFAVISSLLLDKNHGIKMIRDITRGGLSALLNELSIISSLSPVVDETLIPFNKTALSFFTAIGIDLLHSANEGAFVVICDKSYREKILNTLKSDKQFEKASFIGFLEKRNKNSVILKTISGGMRILRDNANNLIPRIC